MRGTRAKLLGRGLGKSERRLAIRRFKAARHARGGFSVDTGQQGPRKGNIAPTNPYARPERPVRGIKKIFAELSDIGKIKALNLKFGPARKHGSEASLRAWPRGRPGQGAASRLAKPELKAAVAGLRKHVGVQMFTRAQ